MASGSDARTARAKLFETRSLPALTRSYPRHFTFYVARPTRSIQLSSFRFLVICWLADGTNTSADVGPKTWPNIRLLRGLGVDHRRRRRWFGSYHHTRPVAADQRLVRLVLRHFGLSANGVAP